MVRWNSCSSPFQLQPEPNPPLWLFFGDASSSGTHTTHKHKQVFELYSSFSRLYLIKICYFTLILLHSLSLLVHKSPPSVHIAHHVIKWQNFVSGFVSSFVGGFVSGRAFLTLPKTVICSWRNDSSEERVVLLLTTIPKSKYVLYSEYYSYNSKISITIR